MPWPCPDLHRWCALTAHRCRVWPCLPPSCLPACPQRPQRQLRQQQPVHAGRARGGDAAKPGKGGRRRAGCGCCWGWSSAVPAAGAGAGAGMQGRPRRPGRERPRLIAPLALLAAAAHRRARGRRRHTDALPALLSHTRPSCAPAPLLQPIGGLVDGDGSVVHVNDRKMVAGERRALLLACRGTASCCCCAGMGSSRQGLMHRPRPCSPLCLPAAMKVRLKFTGGSGGGDGGAMQT